LPACEKPREQAEKQQDIVNNQQQLSFNTPDSIQTSKPKVPKKKCNEEKTFLETASKYMKDAITKKIANSTNCGADDAFINYIQAQLLTITYVTIKEETKLDILTILSKANVKMLSSKSQSSSKSVATSKIDEDDVDDCLLMNDNSLETGAITSHSGSQTNTALTLEMRSHPTVTQPTVTEADGVAMVTPATDVDGVAMVTPATDVDGVAVVTPATDVDGVAMVTPVTDVDDVAMSKSSLVTIATPSTSVAGVTIATPSASVAGVTEATVSKSLAGGTQATAQPEDVRTQAGITFTSQSTSWYTGTRAAKKSDHHTGSSLPSV
jgi:hypothetical protein